MQSQILWSSGLINLCMRKIPISRSATPRSTSKTPSLSPKLNEMNSTWSISKSWGLRNKNQYLSTTTSRWLSTESRVEMLGQRRKIWIKISGWYGSRHCTEEIYHRVPILTSGFLSTTTISMSQVRCLPLSSIVLQWKKSTTKCAKSHLSRTQP